MLQPDHESQRVARIYTEEREPAYSGPEEFGMCEDYNLLGTLRYRSFSVLLRTRI